MQTTVPEPDRTPRAKMTIRVYSVDRAGTVSEPRATVIVPYDDLPEPSLLGVAPLAPCRCPRCREAGAGVE